MKKVAEENGLLVLQLSFAEWAVLGTLLRHRQGELRPTGKLSQSGVGASSEEAQQLLEDSLKEAWTADELAALKLLADSSRCVVAEEVATLRITTSEIDMLLRVINGKRLTAWESLGRPPLASLKGPKDLAGLQNFRILGAADFFLASLLSLYK